MQRTIVIGDVHGCLDELQMLVRKCGVDLGDDVVLVGDLVARGPDSQGVVQYVRESGFTAVLGNHDLHVLRIREGTVTRPPKPAHLEVAQTLRDLDWLYLQALRPYLRLEDHNAIVVHAGMVPGVPVEQQRREDLISMRSIDAAGRPSKRVDAGAPWASLWPGPEHVFFGHDAVRGLQQHPFATGLDTGCVYGRELTAMILPDRTLVSVPARRVYADPPS